MKNQLKKMLTVPYLNLLMVLILFGFVAYSLFAPIVPAVYSKPVVQDRDNVSAGKLITYKIHACRNVGDGVVTTITRKLISVSDKDLQPITLSADTVTNPSGCVDAKKTLIVPYSTPAGQYQLVITGVYNVIPWRKPVTVSASSDSFNLKAADPNQVVIDNSTVYGPIVGGTSSYDSAPVYTPSTSNPSTQNSAPVAASPAPATPAAQANGNNTPPATKPEGTISGLLKALGGRTITPSL